MKSKKWLIIIFIVIMSGILFFGYKKWESKMMDKLENQKTSIELESKSMEVPSIERKQIIKDENGVSIVKNRVIIVTKEGTGESEVQKLLEKEKAVIVSKREQSNQYTIEFEKEKTEKQLKIIIEEINKNPIVKTASFSFIYTLQTTPNDPWINSTKDWNVKSIGLLEAWKMTYPTYKNKVKVGIIDGGFYTNHEDLSIEKDRSLSANGNLMVTEKENPKWKRYNRHGTHVTGVVSAIPNNNLGITGVSWESEIYVYRTVGSDEDIQNGIKWLAENGCRVINISMGNAIKTTKADRERYIDRPKELYTNFLKREIFNQYDVLIIQSAGNDGIDAEWNGIVAPITDKKVREHVIIVGNYGSVKNWLSWVTATGEWLSSGEQEIIIPRNGKYFLSESSNRGKFVDILAPGESIYSTTKSVNEYGRLSGTSQSAPHVTGLASLILTIDPSKTSKEIKELIVKSSNEEIKYKKIEYKMLNAKKAVELATNKEIKNDKENRSFDSLLLSFMPLFIVFFGLLMTVGMKWRKLEKIMFGLLIIYIVYSVWTI